MRRFHLFEIGEQPWCPVVLRDALTDYLRAAIEVGRVYAAVVPLLADALRATRETRVVDLGAGGGGPWDSLAPALAARGRPVQVRLTDRFPNVDAFRGAERRSGGTIVGEPRPVDARSVPADLDGVRTMFSSFHHLRPDDARAVLRDAADPGRAIAIFEATRRDVKAVALTCLTPLFVLLLTPRIRPFRWSRLLLTYLLPVVPLAVLFDGVVSCLRTYTPNELLALANGLGAPGYAWRSGETGDGPIPVTYLIGAPADVPMDVAAGVGSGVAASYIPGARVGFPAGASPTLNQRHPPQDR